MIYIKDYIGQEYLGVKGTHIDGLPEIEDMMEVLTKEDRLIPLMLAEANTAGAKKALELRISNKVNQIVKPVVNPQDGYVYETPPKDFWDGWCQIFLEDLTSNLNLFKEIYRVMSIVAVRVPIWDKDIREGVFTSSVPNHLDIQTTVYAWKQDNNGQTFFWADAPLTDLDADLDLQIY
jgi:hypothetical protein